MVYGDNYEKNLIKKTSKPHKIQHRELILNGSILIVEGGHCIKGLGKGLKHNDINE